MGTRLCTWKHLKGTTVDENRQNHTSAFKIENSGWHFSFLGDAENYKLKLASYEHTENNTQDNIASAEERIEKGIDPFGRNIGIKTVPIDESYPEYIQNNQDKYAHLIKPWN